MAKQSQQKQVADQFSDPEMQGLKAYGEALGGNPTAFDEEVEKRLAGHEKQYAKMRQSQMGLAPEPIEQTGEQQAAKLAQRAAAAGQMQAQQAQAQQTPVNAPPAPAGPQGATQPYQSQRQSQQAPEAPAEGQEQG